MTDAIAFIAIGSGGLFAMLLFILDIAMQAAGEARHVRPAAYNFDRSLSACGVFGVFIALCIGTIAYGVRIWTW